MLTVGEVKGLVLHWEDDGFECSKWEQTIITISDPLYKWIEREREDDI